MTGAGPLYGIRITVEPYDPTDNEPEDEWNARRHRRILFEPTVDPSSQDFTPEELLAAYRWFAGVVARATLRLRGNVEYQAGELKHGCRDQPWDGPCGSFFEDYILHLDPTFAVRDGYSPWLGMMVPTEQAKGWRRYFEQVVGEILVADQQPAPPAPDPIADDEHRRVVPQEPTEPVDAREHGR